MRVLFVEPQYRKNSRKKIDTEASIRSRAKKKAKDDETLWYPPLGLMKLARFHRQRGDEVKFVSGCDNSIFYKGDLFPGKKWDRVYITTLFTYHHKKFVETINFYKDAVGGTVGNIFVGGVAASLMPESIFEETGIYPVTGTITSPSIIDLEGEEDIDELPPDYDLLGSDLYALNETYYGYTTRGCVNKCRWCGVHKIEPAFVPYIDIKPSILKLREEYGDKPKLKLMDNNVLASPQLKDIVNDLVELGYGRDHYTDSEPKKQRSIDFNQGLDASYMTEEIVSLLAELNIKPMRIAFDQLREKDDYINAVRTARSHGFTDFSNYMLYNYKDSPRDLYERLSVNISFNEEWVGQANGDNRSSVYSYPMRFAPLSDDSNGSSKRRDRVINDIAEEHDWLNEPVWTKRFIRSIEIMKGAANGAISPTPHLAWRTVGKDFREFLANLYMPEELLRNRNRHEKYVYPLEPPRPAGSGKVEAFRIFILGLLEKQDDRFIFFHKAVSPNSITVVRKKIEECKDKELKQWLKEYTKK